MSFREIINVYSLCILLLCLFFVSGPVVSQLSFTVKNPEGDTDSREYLWLHVDGKYIRTSPYADPSNGIFVAVGVAYDKDSISGTKDGMVAKWLKEHHCNAIRFDYYPYKRGYFDNMQHYLDTYIDPAVQACIDNQLYVYLDCHEYFHEFLEKDSWFPNGPVWNEETFQKWTDHWVAVAERYKDEPRVLGYELCNEPCGLFGEVSRKNYMRCIQAIRKVDTRHIIILGNNNFTHAANMWEVWGAVKFRPDKPFNQVVFAFHEYANAQNPDVVAPLLDSIQDKYKVPVLCTEFGAEAVVEGVTKDMMRQFEKDMFAMFEPRKIGWSLWALRGRDGDYHGEYEDIWKPAAKNQVSPIPKPLDEKSVTLPEATQIICEVNPKKIYADSPALVSAKICTSDGKRIFGASPSVTFSIKGEATWEDGTTADKVIDAVDGMALINVKGKPEGGKVTVNTSSENLKFSSVDFKIKKAKKK